MVGVQRQRRPIVPELPLVVLIIRCKEAVVQGVAAANALSPSQFDEAEL